MEKCYKSRNLSEKVGTMYTCNYVLEDKKQNYGQQLLLYGWQLRHQRTTSINVAATFQIWG